jgi:hypothetical protein
MLELTKPTSFGRGIEMCTAFFNDNPACSIRLYKEALAIMLYKEALAIMLQIAYQGIGDENKAIESARICLELTEEVGDRSIIVANEAALARLQRNQLKASKSQKDIQERITYLETLFDEWSAKSNGKRIAEPHTLVELAGYLADMWVTISNQSDVEETKMEQILEKAMSWIHLGENILRMCKGTTEAIHDKAST